MLTNWRIKNNFYSDLFEKQKVADLYKSVQLYHASTPIYKSENNNVPTDKLHVQTLVPTYLKTNLPPNLISTEIFQKKGYAVNISDIETIDSYLKKNAGTNFKKNTVRTLKRLEQCFNISYKMFYGDIDMPTYNSLMNTLINMITNRFQERKGRNRVIEDWDHYKNISYGLINKKAASLFVIYSDDEPIEVSLNFHQGTVMYSAISSYNLNFSKFSLGNIDIYRQLEWCMKNNITLFDMGYGDFDYKIKWSNLAYNFNTQVISKKNSWGTKLYSVYLTNKYRFINFLIEKEVTDSVREIIATIKVKKCNAQPYENYKIESIEGSPESAMTEIDHKNEAFSFLKKPLNEFLYSNCEHIKNVKVYKKDKDDSTFIFISPNTTAKVRVINKK